MRFTVFGVIIIVQRRKTLERKFAEAAREVRERSRGMLGGIQLAAQMKQAGAEAKREPEA